MRAVWSPGPRVRAVARQRCGMCNRSGPGPVLLCSKTNACDHRGDRGCHLLHAQTCEGVYHGQQIKHGTNRSRLASSFAPGRREKLSEILQMSANRFSRKITALGVKNSHEQSRAAPFPFPWNLWDGDGVGCGSNE